MRGLVCILALLVGCGSSGRNIRIPDSVVAPPNAEGGGKRRADQPYVIKMSDGRRTWQIEIPSNQASGAFSAVVPLDLGEAAKTVEAKPPTEADKEIAATRPTPADAEKDGPGRSYLATLAKVSELFRRRQYELALIEIVALDREYPDDERILEMKGTLYWRLKRPKLAREAWERVLTLNPENATVAAALENLLGE